MGTFQLGVACQTIVTAFRAFSIDEGIFGTAFGAGSHSIGTIGTIDVGTLLAAAVSESIVTVTLGTVVLFITPQATLNITSDEFLRCWREEPS